MSEIEIKAGSNRHKTSLRWQKKLSTKVDLTPMVDLGFLLITFFIVTTTLSKPRVTNLIMPADGDSTNLGKDAALTILPGKDNKIFYYHGTLNESLRKGTYGVTGYSETNGIGEVIRKKQLALDKYYKGGRKELMLLIKPSAEASYQNVVALLDEAAINVVLKYALLKIGEEEKQLLEHKLPK